MNARATPKVALRPMLPTDVPFLAEIFCASIEDQFEFLLGQWGNLNPMGPDNRGNSKDPLIGNHQAADAIFDMPTDSEQLQQIYGFKPFVKTRGMLYAFFPSISSLKYIAGIWQPERPRTTCMPVQK